MSIIMRLLVRLIFVLPDLPYPSSIRVGLQVMRAKIISMYESVSIGNSVRIHRQFYSPTAIAMCLGDGVEIKEDVRVGRDGDAERTGSLSIGRGTLVLSGSRIDCSGDVYIGEASHIGRNCQIISHSHDTSDSTVPVLEAPVRSCSVTIGSDVMIYSDVVILPGVSIGDGAVVAIRSVVTGDVAPYSVVGGIPAKIIGERS